MLFLLLIGTFGLGFALLWNEPKWGLFAAFAAIQVVMSVAFMATMGAFSEQSFLSLADLVTFGAFPAVFLVAAPFVTLFRGMHLRSKRRRDEEDLAAELARFSEDPR
jgi:asparagine N-glycosylation enzyme membrane subunit Stt3